MAKALTALGVLVLMTVAMFYCSYSALVYGFGLEVKSLGAWLGYSLSGLALMVFGNLIIKYILE